MERSNVAESENQQQSEKVYFSPVVLWDQLFEAPLNGNYVVSCRV